MQLFRRKESSFSSAVKLLQADEPKSKTVYVRFNISRLWKLVTSKTGNPIAIPPNKSTCFTKDRVHGLMFWFTEHIDYGVLKRETEWLRGFSAPGEGTLVWRPFIVKRWRPAWASLRKFRPIIASAISRATSAPTCTRLLTALSFAPVFGIEGPEWHAGLGPIIQAGLYNSSNWDMN